MATAGRKGGAKTGGRSKGTPNKATANLKEAILQSFASVGGKAYLDKIAKTDPRTYCTLLGKVLPTTVAGDEDNPLIPTSIEVRIVEPKR